MIKPNTKNVTIYIIIFPLLENTIFNFANSQHDHLDPLQVHKTTFCEVALQSRKEYS